MERVAAARACGQFLWLLLGLILVVEGRMLPTARPHVTEPCKFTWQLPGTDCWRPFEQGPRCDHLNSEGGCAGSSLAVASKTTAGVDQVEAVATSMWEDSDCEPVPGRLLPIHCQNPTVMATKGDFSHHGQTEVQEDPGCKPFPGRLPPSHCQDPSSVQITKGGFAHHAWTEVQEDVTDLQIHCEGCSNWPPTVTSHMNQDQTMTAASTMELEDPDCKPFPGRLPPIRCQNPTMKAEGGLIQVAKVVEACQYTWQLPGTDCWPPIRQWPRCNHLNRDGCEDSPPFGN